MTYNVNFGMAGDRATVNAIRKGKADVVFLQETTPRWERHLRRALRKVYPHILFKHHGRAGGLAVLSKYPFKDADYIPAPTKWFPAWRVVVQTPIGPVQALNVHLRPPIDKGSWVRGFFTTGGLRLSEMQHYVTFLAKELPTIILGDFNEAKGGALDLLEDRKMRNALFDLKPNTRTWHWPTRYGELTQALDHVYAGPRLEAVKARVMKAGRSDHYPVVVKLRRVY